MVLLSCPLTITYSTNRDRNKLTNIKIKTMNITPEEFIKLLSEGKTEYELNRNGTTNKDHSAAEVKKLIKYGHTVESAHEHLTTDYSDGFTICKNCGTYYHSGQGFSKHMSNGCYHCEGQEKHYTYWHKGNNERNYKTEPRWMSQYFDDKMHYCRDKAEKGKYLGLILAHEVIQEDKTGIETN